MKIQGFILLLLTIAGIAFISFISQCSHGLSENAQRRSDEQKAKPTLTIENAPTNMLRGELYRLIDGDWRGPSTTNRVVSLNPTDFDVVFADAFGDDWTFRWTAGAGHWTRGSQTNQIVSLQQDGSRGQWSGHMVDPKSSKQPIFFKMKFWFN